VNVVADPVSCSIIRTVVVATVASGMAACVQRWLDALTGRRRQLALCLVLSPLFIPDLLLGFTYRLTAARLVDFPAGTEFLYAALGVCRCLPVAVAVSVLLPVSMVSRESIHLWQQLGNRAQRPPRWRWHWLILHVSGPWRPAVIAWCLMGLLTFQEFEMAALIQIDRHPVVWTVWLFDAHAAWQPLADSFQMLQLPMLFESLLLLPVILVLHVSRPPVESAAGPAREPASPSMQFARTSLGAASVLLLTLLMLLTPIWINSGLLYRSGRLALTSPGVLVATLGQIGISFMFAVAAAVVALLLGRWCLQSKTRLLLIVPGMMGALTSSLCCVLVFQMPGINRLYDTWLPLLLGLVMTNLPRAVVVLLAVRRLGDSMAVYSAQLLRTSHSAAVRAFGTQLTWRLVSYRWLLAATILTHWCFWDVTTVSILRPVDVEPVITRLYNEMHYGRTEVLALATLISCLVTPLTGVTVAFVWQRFRNRRLSR
jgi:hypothetical protein